MITRSGLSGFGEVKDYSRCLNCEKTDLIRT
jgi:hypothetical protein